MFTTRQIGIPSRSTLQQYERDLETLQKALEETPYTLPVPLIPGDRQGSGYIWRPSFNPKFRALTRQREALEALIRGGWAARSPQLPTDIVQSTLDNFIGQVSYEPPPPAPRPAPELRTFVRGLCLVCKAWLAPARRVLYRDVGLSHDGWKSFVQTVRTTPAVRNFVQHVTGWPDAFVDGTWLSLLPNYTAELRVSLGDRSPGLTDMWTKVVTQDREELKKIIVYGDDEECADVEGLTQMFSHLETLELSNCDFYVTEFPFAHGFPGVFFASLNVLKLEYCQNAVFPRTSANTLQKIILSRSEEIDAVSFIRFIGQQAKSLRDISVSSTGFSYDMGMDVFVELARAATCVERLEVDTYEWRSSPVFLSIVSPSLVELRLRDDGECVSHLDIIGLLKRKRVSDLRYLKLVVMELPKSQYEEGARKWEEVRSAAEEAGVVFSLSSRS
jgi:hypothetical protein